MRPPLNPPVDLGTPVDIGSIRLNPPSRDDLPALLLGLQPRSRDPDWRARLFAGREAAGLPGVDRHPGRPGRDRWQILVMAPIKPGWGGDFDRVQELVNQPVDGRALLGHGPSGGTDRRQQVVDNVSGLTPERLAPVSALVGESGQVVAKKAGRARARARAG